MIVLTSMVIGLENLLITFNSNMAFTSRCGLHRDVGYVGISRRLASMRFYNPKYAKISHRMQSTS